MNESVLADLIRPGTSRGLDFIIVDELRKRKGIVHEEILKFAVGEMIANALDTDATKIFIETRTLPDDTEEGEAS
jgi:hypothetical protein